jgi:hypothetical protein
VRVVVRSRTEIESLLDPDDVRGTLRAAMVDVSDGRASVPDRVAAVVPSTGLLATMPKRQRSAGAEGATETYPRAPVSGCLRVAQSEPAGRLAVRWR